MRPYHFGSAIRPEFDRDAGVHEALRRTLVELFPALAGVEVTHRWGGPLASPATGSRRSALDRVTGLAWAGGYVGDGVSTTNLAGRTLRDLDPRPRHRAHRPCPGSDHRSPAGEPEPLRYLGINAGLRLAGSADRAEEQVGAVRPGGPRVLERVLGG